MLLRTRRRVRLLIYMNNKWTLIAIIIVVILLAFYVWPQAFNNSADAINNKFGWEVEGFHIPHFFSVPDYRLGLDVQGGAHLVYQADFSSVNVDSKSDAMAGVRDLI